MSARKRVPIRNLLRARRGAVATGELRRMWPGAAVDVAALVWWRGVVGPIRRRLRGPGPDERYLSQRVREAMKRLGEAFDRIDAATRRPGEPSLRAAVAEHARQQLAAPWEDTAASTDEEAT